MCLSHIFLLIENFPSPDSNPAYSYFTYDFNEHYIWFCSPDLGRKGKLLVRVLPKGNTILPRKKPYKAVSLIPFHEQGKP